MASNPELIAYFTFETKNEDTKYYFSAYFGEGNTKEHVKLEKHKRKCKVTFTFDGKLKCEF